MAEWEYDDFDDFDDGLDEFGIGTPLHTAARQRNISQVESYLSHGANVNTCDGQGRNVLQVAILQENNEGIIRLLLRYGADVIGCSGPHGNALVHAVRANSSIIQLLLDHIASQGSDCHTALESALYYASETDVNAQGGVYRNALTAATIRKHIEVANILLQAGAKDDMSEHEGLSDVNMPADIGLDLFEDVHY
ncbi:hypothetical protein APSETT444_006932 [Aspergillus pseudonomiae]